MLEYLKQIVTLSKGQTSEKKIPAVVLLSGGLDSATCLAIAKQQNFACYALSFDYGQRHNAELEAAKKIAATLDVAEHRVIPLDLAGFGGSALTDESIEVPTFRSNDIPITYVPARNTVFLSIALAWAEVLEAQYIFIGVNAVDYSGYPDCRPEYISAFQTMANLATKAAIEGKNIQIETPLLNLSKTQIIKKGIELGLDYSLTISCYQANKEGQACGLCDSCRIRKQAFLDAGVLDPTIYA